MGLDAEHAAGTCASGICEEEEEEEDDDAVILAAEIAADSIRLICGCSDAKKDSACFNSVLADAFAEPPDGETA